MSASASAMEHWQIGSLKVSRIGLGGAGFGWRTSYEESEAIINAALDCGINFFDTANIYGDGLSEEYLGRAVRGRRDQVVISTKFGYVQGPRREMPTWVGPGRQQIVDAVEGSLSRLGVDCIDLYQQHAPDTAADYAETLEAMQELMAAGKVREIGCSRFEADHIRTADRVADEGGLPPFVSCQSALSLLRRDPLDDVLPTCRELGLALIAFNPLATGFLAGGGRPSSANAPASYGRLHAFVASDEGQRQIQRLRDYAASYGRTTVELAIAWVAAQPGVVTVLTGASRPEQVRANAGRGIWNLNPQQLEEINGLVA